MKALSRLLGTYLKPYWHWLLADVVFQFIAAITMLYVPTFYGHIIDNGVAKGDTRYIWHIGALMLGISALQVLATIAAVFCGSRAAMGWARDIRRDFFHTVTEFSSKEVHTFGAPSLITRNTNDVQQVQTLLAMALTLALGAPIIMVGGIVMALQSDRQLTWIMVLSIVLLAVVVTLVATRLIPLFRSLQTKVDSINQILREQITGIRVVRAFVREPLEAERFDESNVDLSNTTLRVGQTFAIMFPAVLGIVNLSTVAVMWFGARLIDGGSLQIGSMMAFMQYLMQILMAVLISTFLAIMAPRAAVSAERIEEVLQTERSVKPAALPLTKLAPGAVVEFDGVGFAYPGADAPVLQDITFTARPGQVTAIIGSTGSGKTTLLSLLPRLFDATSGAVRINGTDVRDLDQGLLWSRLGLVPQRPYLFSGTVASNLRYGKDDATEEEMWNALRIAQAEQFVRERPGGLESHISQGGTDTSGGQRQRLSMARAIIRRPDIYLFDDSFSALDLRTDAELRAALAPETRESTVLVVAQRVATVVDADQIIVLEDGRIVGLGTHDELLARCSTYKEIVDSQLGVEDAA